MRVSGRNFYKPIDTCSCQKLKLGRTGQSARDWQLPGRTVESAHPSSTLGADGPYCSIFASSLAGDGDAARRRQRHDRGNLRG
jgi:hypothetical protein